VLARRKMALTFLALAVLSVSAIGIVWLTRPEPPLNRTLVRQPPIGVRPAVGHGAGGAGHKGQPPVDCCACGYN
jgi:hypothetical protein